ncbi:MAG: M23 family metallopeptidase [Ruminococcus sp.]|nr:M23 family metallopeptidase [Ruminococcus sp.]
MKKYKHANDKKPTERVSFYIALSICLMAVGFAAWSAYSAFNGAPEPSDNTYFSSLSTEKAAVAQEMTGITEPETQPPTQAATQPPTQAVSKEEPQIIISETKPDKKQDVMHDDASTPLKAVLKINESLVYPVKSQQVTNPYSEDGVYNKTLHDYRAHTGCDFAAEEGENIYAMCGGTVKDISVSELYGVILEVDCGDFTVYYCGLDTDFLVEKEQEVSTGDTIGTVGHIPCESEDDAHVHIEIRVGDQLVDPLSVIGPDD